MWVLFFIVAGALNIYVAYSFSEPVVGEIQGIRIACPDARLRNRSGILDGIGK